ncbi:MAG: hypothetical protein RIS54_2144 [Verrucomicrobiota bacterium]|jgi:tetratricopeptide (TPR) repeat protein
MDKKGDPEFDIGFYESVLRRSPDYTEVIEILGGLYTRQGRIADGLRMDRRLVRHLPENPTAHYNLGCSLALMKRPTDALRALRRAVDLGYTDADWMEQDPDLKDLRKRPEFGDLLRELKHADRPQPMRPECD